MCAVLRSRLWRHRQPSPLMRNLESIANDGRSRDLGCKRLGTPAADSGHRPPIPPVNLTGEGCGKAALLPSLRAGTENMTRLDRAGASDAENRAKLMGRARSHLGACRRSLGAQSRAGRSRGRAFLAGSGQAAPMPCVGLPDTQRAELEIRCGLYSRTSHAPLAAHVQHCVPRQCAWSDAALVRWRVLVLCRRITHSQRLQ